MDGESAFKCLNTQYLNRVSNNTGNVATNKKIKLLSCGNPKCFKIVSNKISHP